ncbi:TonB-dependent receptor [Alishewanella longhuensis]|uniref:TonB-dependent receptor n=1 Tax=Alishewanella longhuensis TaxID=1091037 RepID=A0ABQ3KY54_9ALTE|nr:TonB-dependent receptor [Alishewanella longhuensis]GHG60612.1 TonB-dependent receptor [Alishewanella longhuensis]
MKKYNKVTLAVRRVMLSSVAASLSLVAAPGLAEEDAAAKVERIEITGSRIKRTEFESSVPVTVITADEIMLTGATNLADVLHKSPVAIAAADQSNVTFSLNSAGLNTTSLRNAGSARTLVLVNGRRFVSGTAPSVGYAVDLNAIPAAVVDRIEILKSASSAVYGSDAVAGVINIITKKNIDGAELRLQSAVSDQNDRRRQDIDLTVGQSWNGGNAWMSFGFHDDAGIGGPERPEQTTDLASVNGSWVPVLSGYNPAGLVQIPGVGNFKGDGSPYVAATDGYDRGSRRQLLIPLKRKYIAGQLNHEINPSLNFFSEFNWMQVESSSAYEPTPLNLLDIWLKTRGGTGGHLVEGSLVIPDALQQVLLSNNITNLNQLNTIGRRMTEFGDRGNEANRSTSRLATGLDWYINDNWSLNSYLTWGQTTQNQFGYGELNMDRARLAMDLIQLDGKVQCRDETARLQGCVPFNIFGANTVSPAAVDYLRAPSKTIGVVEQLVLGTAITGELPFELPGGVIGLAAGLEFREESGKQEASDLAQIGATSSNRQLPTDGKFSVRDAFLEARFPVLDNWVIDTAIRTGNYSSVGNVFTWNLGTEYSPSSGLKLRASAAQAVRAPNVSDLFGGQTETFATVTDVCDGVKVGDSGTIAQNCLSVPAIFARAAANPATGFLLTQLEKQQTGGFIGGNPNVREETAKTYSIGAVAELMDGLSMTVDWYSISIDDAITTTSRSLVLSRCYTVTSGFDATCAGQARRDPETGALSGVDSGAGNENQIDIQGVDVELRYATDLPIGLLTADFIYSHLNKFDITSIESGKLDSYAGEVLYPKHRFNINLGYKLDDFNLYWRMRYWHKVEDSLTGQDQRNVDFGTGGRIPDELNTISAKMYHDLQLGYQLNANINLYLGVNNLFDQKAPILAQGTNYGSTGINTASEAYDVTGRYYYLGLRASF